MRRVLIVSWVLLAAGCAREQAVAWVPRLYVRAQAVIDRGSVRDARSSQWQVEGGVGWDLSRPPAPLQPVDDPRPPPAVVNAPCAHAAICAWEQRERARALAEGLELAGIAD